MTRSDFPPWNQARIHASVVHRQASADAGQEDCFHNTITYPQRVREEASNYRANGGGLEDIASETRTGCGSTGAL
ncbi:DNA topoisomerase 2-alpha [Anopheles sinensis]|uniref:DNA topoisomerase 2-alpha n=1 Tax=Anopheles sinensis TaxID=74873 RepID=A0A084VY47_ANOSI|nr:DNA topoisomerase 2-alpha [Anopheles sinensis]